MPFELAGSLDADGKGVGMKHDHDEDDEPVWLWAEHEVRVCEPYDMPSCAPSCENALFLFLRNSKGAAVASGETELQRILDEKITSSSAQLLDPNHSLCTQIVRDSLALYDEVAAEFPSAPETTYELDRRFQAKQAELVDLVNAAAQKHENQTTPHEAAAASGDSSDESSSEQQLVRTAELPLSTGRLACEEVAAGLALVNDLLTATTRLWQDDERMCELLTPDQLAGYITFAWGQMHWSRLPFPELAKHKTAELIRCAINDRIAQYNGQFGAG